jgi:hypothetical protein
MSEPLVLVVLFGTSADPTADGLMATVKAALGRDAVVLADSSDSPTDADALAIGARVHSWAIARVSWADSSFQRARLHVHVATANEWADDEIQFLPQDATSEKGRTLGYALASMVHRIAQSTPSSTDEASKESPMPARARPVDSPAGAQTSDTRVEASRSTLVPGVDVFVHGTGAVGGGATSAGGGGGIRWWPLARVGLRGAVGARAGRIAEAQASTTTLFAAAGPSYRIPLGTMVELGARADFVLLQHSVSRATVVETTHTRWLGALDLMLETSWFFGPHTALMAAAGAEVAFGTTSVSVGGMPMADIPPARAVGELGLRFRF